MFSETEKKVQYQKNQKLTKICQKKSTSAPSAELTCGTRTKKDKNTNKL